MRTLAISLAAVAILACAGDVTACGEQYGVSISASATDPGMTHIDVAPAGEFQVSLWLTCSPDGGIAAFAAIVVSDFDVLDFVPNTNVLNAGTADTVMVAIGGCPEAPSLVGHWVLSNPAGMNSGSVCLADYYGVVPPPSGTGVDCDCLGTYEDVTGVTGFSAGAAVSCDAANGCEQPSSVEGVTWSRLKVRFRTPAN